MNELTALEAAERHLHDALEYLTFDEFGWAFEELWHGVALSLAAERAVEPTTIAPIQRDMLPPAGALLALLDHEATSATTRSLVARLEAARDAIALDPHPRQTRHAVIVSALVFGAWTYVADVMAQQAPLAHDPSTAPRRAPARATSESPAVPAPWQLGRRTALKVLSAGAAASLAACKPAEQPAANAAVRVEPSAPVLPPPRVTEVTSLSRMHWPTTDPFLFCAYHVDHYPAGDGRMAPAVPLDGRALGRDFDESNAWRMYHGQTVPGFPRHPHRGFETVTVVRRGFLDHADSVGAKARYSQGDVQWLTAGDGIQHAEMFPLLREDTDNPAEFFQIWMNLPARNKRVPAHFSMLWSESIPRVTTRDAAGRRTEIILDAGAYAGHTPPPPPPHSWASQPESDVAIWSVRMEPGAQWELPSVGPQTVRSLYVHQGAGVRVGTQEVANRHRVVLDGPGPILLEAGAAPTEILLLQGRPIGEPIARRGPFVMNTPAEIQEAYDDYRRTQFGGWPWPEDGPVHARERGRFARTIDGRFEEPG